MKLILLMMSLCLAADLPIDCSLPALFVIILYFMGGLTYSAGAFFATLFSVLLLVLVAQSFGLLVGAIVPVPKTAQTLTTVVALSMVSFFLCFPCLTCPGKLYSLRKTPVHTMLFSCVKSLLILDKGSCRLRLRYRESCS